MVPKRSHYDMSSKEHTEKKREDERASAPLCLRLHNRRRGDQEWSEKQGLF